MLRHALDPLFQPRSLMVVTDQALPVMQSLPAALGKKTTLIESAPGSLASIPAELEGLAAGERLDLALICMPPLNLAHTLDQLEAAPPRALIILAHEAIDPDPASTRAFCAKWARAHGCALLGPFAFGLQRPSRGLNLSQHRLLAKSGRVALIAQSRSIMAGVLDWADDVHIGFSAAVALGDELDTRISEVLDYLATDSSTDSIAIYLEEVSDGREFMSALRSAASVKPVVVLRSGSLNTDPREEEAFDAALRRAGAVRVRYFVQLFSALKVFMYRSRPKGRRVAVFSNGEGPAQLALDMAFKGGPIVRATLSDASRNRLNKFLAPGSLICNPVVTHQPLSAVLINDILGVLLQDDGVDGVVACFAPDSRSDFPGVVEELARLAPVANKPVLTCMMGDAGMRPLRRTLDNAGTSAFRTPESTANAFGILASHHYNQQLLLQIQPAEPDHALPVVRDSRERLRLALEAPGARLERDQAWALLADFHVPLTPLAQDQAPVSVTEYPCAIRVETDSLFGPVVRFGAGGMMGRIAVDQDGVDLAPLNHFLAKRLLQRSHIWQQMLCTTVSGAALSRLLLALELISDLVSECPEIESITIDPIVIRDATIFVEGLDIVLRDGFCQAMPAVSGYEHMAIHPYPRRWVEKLLLKNGVEAVIRPIRPDDALALQQFVRDLSDQARYMRFVSMMRELTPKMLARYTQLDYHREFALVATVVECDASGVEAQKIIGLSHYLLNPDGQGAEYALVVADDWQGQGLGKRLMTRLTDAAREQGLRYIEGMVLSNNRPMLTLMTKSMGMRNDPDPDDPTGMRRVWMTFNSGPAPEMH